MKSLLWFLALFVPLTFALWSFGRESAPRPGKLPEQAPEADGPTVLGASDFAPDGEGDAAWKVRRLNGVGLQVVADGYVQFYLTLDRVQRVEGRPQLERVVCAVFDEPRDDRPQLRLTIESPFAKGDPAQLLGGTDSTATSARIVTLDGGVVVRDARGRTLAELDEVRIDPDARTLESPSRARIRYPEGGAQLLGSVLSADLDLRTARLASDITAYLPAGRGRAELACDGPAVLREDKESRRVEITLENRTRVDHPALTAHCDRAEATVVRGDDAYELRRALLDGHVRIGVDPTAFHGLEFAELPRVSVEAEGDLEKIELEGPVHASRRGPLDVLGLGERMLDLVAGGAELFVRRPATGGVELVRARFFGGVKVTDRGGAGFLEAGEIDYDHAGRRLIATGGVRVRTPDGFAETDTLRAHVRGRRDYDLLLEGDRKRVEYVADGRLGPIGEARRGTLAVTCRGPLALSLRDESIDCTAEAQVRVTLADRQSLVADELVLAARGRELAAVTARGAVEILDSERGGTVRGDVVAYRDRRAELEGAPAIVRHRGGREVRARKLRYHENGEFAAGGDVFVRAILRGREPWEIRCGRAAGTLVEEEGRRRPRSVEAHDGVVATGPDGQRVEGSDFSFDGEKSAATLRGEPARVVRGDVRLEAPGFDLEIVDRGISAGRTRGRGSLDFRPADAAKKGTFHRWLVRFEGPAAFRGERLEIPDGASLEAFAAEAKPRLVATAKAVTLELKRLEKGFEPVRLTGRSGVIVRHLGEKPVAVSADRLAYEVGSKRVEVRGNAQVDAAAWAKHVSFERVVFVVTRDGIDLRRASRVEVVGNKR